MLHQLNETVVGDRSGKLFGHMSLHIAEVEMLHAPETPKMKAYLNGNDLAVRHHWGLLGGIPDQVTIEFLFEILAEPVHQVEYLCNFIFCDLHGKVLIINVL